MSESMYRYYERELLFIRQMAQEFARQYPAAAGRLLLEPNRSVDPHIERLIESFALLAGRVQHKLDDEFPELTDALLNILYPHYLAPIPSMAVVQFDPRPGADADEGRLPSAAAQPAAHQSGQRPAVQVPHRLPGDAVAGGAHRRPLARAAVPRRLSAAAADRGGAAPDAGRPGRRRSSASCRWTCCGCTCWARIS